MKRLKRALSGLTALCLALSLVPAMASAAETSGSFTVTSMNVDGLPNTILGIPINSFLALFSVVGVSMIWLHRLLLLREQIHLLTRHGLHRL